MNSVGFVLCTPSPSGLLPDVPVAGELDWLGFVVDDLAHRRARAPEVTRCVRLAADGGGGGGAGAWVVTTRRRFDEGGGVREVRI